MIQFLIAESCESPEKIQFLIADSRCSASPLRGSASPVDGLQKKESLSMLS